MKTSPNISKPRFLGPAPIMFVCLALVLGLPLVSHAQTPSPVYVNDAPAAAESISRVDDLVRVGNLREAASVLQLHLDADANRLVLSPNSDSIYIPVRSAIHNKLLATPLLLDAYRQTFLRTATQLLDTGRDSLVERAYLLTTPGYEATLRVAQRELEHARFHAARLYLIQLDTHPDRKGDGAVQAAQLATLLLTYLDDEDFRARTQRWRRDAKLDPALLPAQVLPAIPQGRSSLDEFSSVDLASLVSTPLRSSPLSITVLDSDTPVQARQSREQISRQREWAARGQFVMPSLMGEILYVNDGVYLRALERFTLATLWEQPLTSLSSQEIRTRILRRPNQNIEDLSSVAVTPDHVIVVEGIAAEGTRLPATTIASFDPSSGDLQWRIDPATQHESLVEASVRGPVHIVENTLVVSFVKQVRQRRLLSVLMAGFDPQTGNLRWVEPLCSSGSLPYGQQYLPAQQLLVESGLAYRVNRLGAVACVEIATGRIVWIRLETANTPVATARAPWKMPSPLLIDGTLYTFSPDETRLLALDADTGALRWDRTSDSFGDPRYLDHVGTTLLAVNDASVTTLDLTAEDPATHPVEVLIPPQQELFVGRLALGQNMLVLPQTSGLLVEFLDSDVDPLHIPLQSAGNVLITQSQIIVTDEQAMHSYLLWDVAEELLLERMRLSPDDPTSASTYARLAYEDGRADRILQAIDHALRAIEANPQSQTNRRVRRVLFDAVLEMAVQEPAPGTPNLRQRSKSLPRAIRTQLFERLDNLASSSEQRVTALFARGAFHERAGEPEQALEIYQRILSSRQLSNTQFTQVQVTHIAWRTATERTRSLVVRYGMELYARFNAQAVARFAQGMRTLDNKQVEHFSRQYPLSGASAQAWALLARRYADDNKPRSAIASLEQSIGVALDSRSTSQPWFPQIASDLVTLLEAHGRTDAAIDHLESLAAAVPGLQLQTPLGVVSAQDRLSELRERIVASTRPRIGFIPERPTISAIDGWVLEEPFINIDPDAALRVCIMGTTRELALWEINSEGGLRSRWTISREPTDTPVWFNDTSVLLSRFTLDGRILVMLNARDGTERWVSTPPRGEPGNLRMPVQPGDALHIDVPIGLPRSIHETLLTSNENIVVLTERSGLCWAVNTDTGAVLWVTQTMGEVFDAVCIEDTVAIAGRAMQGESFAPTVMILSLGDGQIVHQFQPSGGDIAWMRVSSERDLVLGMDDAIAAWDPLGAIERWRAAGVVGFATVDAWSFPGRLLVLSNIGELRQLDAETGKPIIGVLDTRNRFQGFGNGLQPIRTALLGDLAALSTRFGTVLFDHQGRLAGADSATPDLLQVPASFGKDAFVTISQKIVSTTNRRQWFRLAVHEGQSAALLFEREISLVAQPTAIHLLDQRILIEVGGTTIVLDTIESPD